MWGQERSHVWPAVGNEVSGVAARHHLAGENTEGIPALKEGLEVMLCRVSMRSRLM